MFFFRLTIKMSTLETLLVYDVIIKADCMKSRFLLNNTGDGRRWRSRFKIASIITISPGTELYSILFFYSLLLLLFTFTLAHTQTQTHDKTRNNGNLCTWLKKNTPIVIKYIVLIEYTHNENKKNYFKIIWLKKKKRNNNVQLLQIFYG